MQHNNHFLLEDMQYNNPLLGHTIKTLKPYKLRTPQTRRHSLEQRLQLLEIIQANFCQAEMEAPYQTQETMNWGRVWPECVENTSRDTEWHQTSSTAWSHGAAGHDAVPLAHKAALHAAVPKSLGTEGHTAVSLTT
jgi:hypothetical protein